ncbi:MAG TPA: DUF4142 domain-containing protein [Candidatus Binatia bacterium]|nr:DUF4142 domain-containing protein [Candidatus Binatia bacterium]
MKQATMGLTLSLLAVTGCALAAKDKDKGFEPMEPSKTAEVVMSNDEKDFFETAASANMFEVAAGKLAQTMGGSETVKEYGTRMVADHTKATAELKDLAEKKGVQLPTAMLTRHQKMYNHLKKQKAGKDFDGAFHTAMLVSHKEAVSLFDKAARKSKDDDVKEFAAKVLPTLQEHGGMAKDLAHK